MTKTTIKKRPSSKHGQTNWKGKAPNRGQWKQQETAEKEEFQTVCKQLGVSPNWAMRSMARHSSGFLEMHGEILGELKSITRQISGLATNINQIAKAGNRTLDPDYRAFMEDRRALGKQLASVELLMQQVLNVGKRRSDGLARLKQAVDAA